MSFGELSPDPVETVDRFMMGGGHNGTPRAAARGVQWVQLHPSIFEKPSFAPIDFGNLS